MNDINIINGTIVRPEGCEKADIGIRGGKIVSVNKPGSLTEAAEKTIDASGLYVFPGMIDTHVHIRGGILSHRESFASGTQAAASGGITTIMEMPIANPPASTPEAFDARRKEIGEQAYVDFCMYGGAGSDNLDQIELLTSHGAYPAARRNSTAFAARLQNSSRRSWSAWPRSAACSAATAS